MEYVYMSAPDGGTWNDVSIYVSKYDALVASKRYPTMRIEIFKKSDAGTHVRYIPTYAYYMNGEIYRVCEELM